MFYWFVFVWQWVANNIVTPSEGAIQKGSVLTRADIGLSALNRRRKEVLCSILEGSLTFNLLVVWCARWEEQEGNAGSL